MSRSLLAALVALALSGCGSGSSTVDGSADLGHPGADLAASDRWSSYAQGFFAGYCVSCHGPGNQMRDYSQYSQVVRDQAKILCGVDTVVGPNCDGTIQPEQFPIGGGPKPTDGERTRLVAWIAAGLPQ